MANITDATILDGVATLSVDDATGIVAGSAVHVYGTSLALGTNKVDGHHVVALVDGLEISYPVNYEDVETTGTPGAVLVESVSWTDADELQLYLGITITDPDELAYAEHVADVANHWCWHRRESAGYHDSPLAAPEPNVLLACTIMAADLFRQRGSVETFQSFDQFPVVPPVVGQLGQILRLLRVSRMAIG